MIMVVAAEAEDRVIAAVAVNKVIAEGDTIQRIDGFGVVRSFDIGHDSLPFLVRAKFHNRSIRRIDLSDGRRREIDVVAHVHVI